MNVELIGWIATVLLLVGYYLNAQKKIVSWSVWALGNTIMFLYAHLIQSYSVMFLSFVLVALNIYGYYQWSRDESLSSDDG